MYYVLIYSPTYLLRFKSLMAHGLDKKHGDVAVVAYWTRLGDLLEASLRQNDNIICGVDGNCRISNGGGGSDRVVGSLLDVARMAQV